MRILIAASEIYPFAKTGGLADVIAALSKHLSGRQLEVELLLPGYPQLLKRHRELRRIEVKANAGAEFDYDLRYGILEGCPAPVWLTESNRVLPPDTPIYPNRRFDLYLRFRMLSHAAAMIAAGANTDAPPFNVLHTNDWHTGLAFNFLDVLGGEDVARVFTIHNLAFHGAFPHSFADREPQRDLMLYGSKFASYNQFSFLEEALLRADKINTVSPNYAKEVQTEAFGFGFEDLLENRRRDFTGILNGVDYEVWHPEQDQFLPNVQMSFDRRDKAANKRNIQIAAGLERRDDAMLCSFTNRITHQKMIDVIADAAAAMNDRPVQFLFHAQGEQQYCDQLHALAAKYPKRIAFWHGFKEANEHRILASADICLTLSRFEPCGLNALYAMRYGAIPVASPVGGLADTIIDEFTHIGEGNGFFSLGPTPGQLVKSLNTIYNLYSDDNYWDSLFNRAKRSNYSWRKSTLDYQRLYENAVRKRRAIREFGYDETPIHSENAQRAVG